MDKHTRRAALKILPLGIIGMVPGMKEKKNLVIKADEVKNCSFEDVDDLTLHFEKEGGVVQGCMFYTRNPKGWDMNWLWNRFSKK